MFQNLIVAASAVNGKVVSTLEIGKNGMAINWFTDNSWTVRLYLNDSAHPHICVCHTSVHLPICSNVLAGKGTGCLSAPGPWSPAVPVLCHVLTTS